MKNTINLLPQKSPLEEQTRKKRRVTNVFIIISVVVLFLLWFVPFLILQNLNRKEQNLLSDISAKEQNVNKLSEQERLYRTIFSKSLASDVIIQTKKKLLTDIQNLQEFVAPEITLSSVEIDKDDVKMTVGTLDIASAMTFLSDLEDENKIKIFKTLTISSINVNKVSGYRVSIQGQLNHDQK